MRRVRLGGSRLSGIYKNIYEYVDHSQDNTTLRFFITNTSEESQPRFRVSNTEKCQERGEVRIVELSSIKRPSILAKELRFGMASPGGAEVGTTSEGAKGLDLDFGIATL